MGYLNDAMKFVSSIGGGGGGESTASSNQSTVNTTDINIDLQPMSEILSTSQETSFNILATSQEQTANTDKETAQINLLNSELEREQTSTMMVTLDKYLENGKNGLILVGIVAAALYIKKNSKKGGKK